MNWKDTVIKEKQLNKVTSPYITSDRFGLRTKMLEAQAEITGPIAEKAGIQKVVDWGEEPCPHWMGRNHNRRMKRLCHYCWQAFLEVEK